MQENKKITEETTAADKKFVYIYRFLGILLPYIFIYLQMYFDHLEKIIIC